MCFGDTLQHRRGHDRSVGVMVTMTLMVKD